VKDKIAQCYAGPMQASCSQAVLCVAWKICYSNAKQKSCKTTVCTCVKHKSN